MLIKKYLTVLSFLCLALAITFLFLYLNKPKTDRSMAVQSAKNPPDKTLVFIGDSMTEYLGNFDELREDLKKFYPDKNLLLLNYGFSSTNITSVLDRIEKDSTHAGRIFMPVNDIKYDLVFIESFGHNPLSHLSLEQGLKKQNESLDQIIASLKSKNPDKKIVFIATISPNKDRYGEGAVVLPPEVRAKWASERVAYIKNHIEYAKTNNIPLINIYQKSLNFFGTGDVKYINSNDFIHPSPKGIYFISEEIAKFIKDNNLL